MRIMIIPEPDVSINLDAYRETFDGIEVFVTSDGDKLWSLIAQFDPHVIISIGHVGTASGLWSMPVWRRRMWLSLPTGRVSPDAVKMSALSLACTQLDSEQFSDLPLISAVVMDELPAAAIKTVNQIAGKQTYENLEFWFRKNSGKKFLNRSMVPQYAQW